MKELLVVRHGKSSWDAPQLADRERPLNKRGRRDGPDMGRRLRSRGMIPARVVTSDAARARETAALLADALGIEAAAIVVEPRLYAADADAVRAVVAALPDDADRVALVGHNPALHEFLQAASDLRVANFPTAAVACLRFPVSHWREAATVPAEAFDYDFPKSGRR